MKAIKILFIAAISLAGAVLTSCEDDAESTYAQLGAFFRFTPVTATPSSLYPALNNPGEWCYITINGSYYNFKNSDGKTDTYPKTALEQYGSTVWVNGLLVGTPAVPDISGYYSPICYDLVCPNCYESGGIKRNVRITSASLSRAMCDRCKRVYDLQNSGVVVEGAEENSTNSKLYRYRCHYDNNTFIVQN